MNDVVASVAVPQVLPRCSVPVLVVCVAVVHSAGVAAVLGLILNVVPGPAVGPVLLCPLVLLGEGGEKPHRIRLPRALVRQPWSLLFSRLG